MFKDVRYYLSESLTSDSRSNLEYVLNENGAESVDSATSPECTHVISNSSMFEGWQSVKEDVVVVTESWVTRSILLGKQQNPKHFSTDPGMIFSGVCACASELQPGDIEILSAGIAQLGGQWRSGLTKDITHLFVVKSGSEKYQHALEYSPQTGLKIVVPHWFDDSVKLGVRDLDTTPYEWPDPQVLKNPGKSKSQDASKKNRQLDPKKEAMLKIAAWSPSSKIPQIERKKVFGGRKILLSTTLELDDRRQGIEAGIERSDGEIVYYETNDGAGDMAEELRNLDECDIYITKYRVGAAYYKAVRAKKTIGTLQWLFHVEATGALTRPLDQLLHYPIPNKPVEGFKGHEITITNYTGEARDYLKRLIAAMGAQFTPTMSPRNTVLIAADIDNGAKTERALAWSIPIVNHLWLEDCFVQWRNLTVGLDKYISHPPGYNFYSNLGQRGYSKAVEDLEEIVKREAEEQEEAEKSMTIPPGTESSAKDVREVADFVQPDLMDVDEIANNDAEMRFITPKSSPVKKSVRSETVAASSSGRGKRETQVAEGDRPDDDDTGTEEAPVSRRTRKPAVMSGGRRRKEIGNDENYAGSMDKQEGSTISGRKAAPISGRKQGRTAGEAQRSPPLTKKSKKKDADGDVAMEGVVEPKKGKKVSTKSKPAPAQSSDTEEDDVESEEEAPKKRATRKAGAKDQDDNLSDTTPTPKQSGESSKSPAKRNPVTPSRSQVSVVVPSLRSNVESPRRGAGTSDSPTKSAVRRTESIHVSANEQGRESIRPARISATSAPLSSPPSTGQRYSKRSAATKATQRLHDTIMPDVVLYQQEMKRSKSRKSIGSSSVPPEDTVTSGKRRSSTAHDDEEDEVVTSSRKGKGKATDRSDGEEDRSGKKGNRKAMSVAFDDTDAEDTFANRKRKSLAKGAPDKAGTSEPEGESQVDGRQPKKRKLAGSSNDNGGSPSTAASVRILTTQVTLDEDVSKALTKLGVKNASKPWDCTHLVVKQLVRTEKFLCAVATGAFIVTAQWAIDSAAAKKLLPEDRYILKDPVGEKKYDFRLKDALERARSRKGRMLDRHIFYVTPKVSTLTDTKMLKSLVTACGGQYLVSTPTLRILDANEDRHVISCPEDASIWRQLSHKHPVYTHELLLTGILKQEMDWDNDKFKVPGSI